jgi:hypothetical protein
MRMPRVIPGTVGYSEESRFWGEDVPPDPRFLLAWE